jgi:hypothetical protein
MPFLRRHSPFLVAALLLCIAVWLMYPYCCYYIDPDGTAYLSIARRYAYDHGVHAVNGYWSPLSCWLTALGMRAGLGAVPAAVWVNLLGAQGFLLVSYSLFRRFGIQQYAQWLFAISLSLFLSYAVYYQLFADLWECCLLLTGLRLLLAEDFLRAPLLWIAYGVTGALAYFAKAYAFPFFLLHTAVSVFFLTQKNKKQWLRICTVSALVLLTCSFPWIWLLHERYGRWMTSTAGTLNLSWYLEGHAHYKKEFGCLLPPAYPDAVYHWEDPYLTAGDLPHFWTSGHYFLLQCARVVQNFLKMAGSMSALSLFFFPLWIACLLVFCRKKSRQQLPLSLQLLMIFFLLFPLAFLLINFEPRYIWSLVPPGMILGYTALQQLRKRQRLAVSIFAVSFVAWPMLDIGSVWDVGKAEFVLAQQLQAQHIKGSFTADTENNKDIQRMVRLAYFSGNSFYVAPVAGCSWQHRRAEIRRYDIRYYFAYGKKDSVTPVTDENGKPFEIVFAAGDLQVYYIRPVVVTPAALHP